MVPGSTTPLLLYHLCNPFCRTLAQQEELETRLQPAASCHFGQIAIKSAPRAQSDRSALDPRHISHAPTPAHPLRAFAVAAPATRRRQLFGDSIAKRHTRGGMVSYLAFEGGTLMTQHSLSDEVKRAREVLRGVDIPLADLRVLAGALKDQQAFNLARKLVYRARRHPEFLHLSADDQRRLGQQHALYTYKDPDLAADARLERALEILTEVDDPAHSINQETLGLAGAIFKRKWQVGGQRRDLESSLAFYCRGHNLGTGDEGWNAINTAFVLELLAREDATVARLAGGVRDASRCEEARKIRSNLIAKLAVQPPATPTWWRCATLAEAHFGLAQYEEATNWLRSGLALNQEKPWERRSTFEQLQQLAHVQADLAADPSAFLPRARACLVKSFDGFAPEFGRTFDGKLGLALSGGGFRASFFHLGVLARLADQDLLRHVEALSCVSGGSIVGAHYYLELQALLERKPDRDIKAEDYQNLVQRVVDEFFAAAETNLRCRVLASVWANLKAFLLPGYTATRYLGELYESEIYSRVEDGRQAKPRRLPDLRVEPKGEAPDFKPKYENWRRVNKVPILVLNATSLNTGHNWQFTASWMGEPPSAFNSEIDGNYRFRRMYYEEAPELASHWRWPLLRSLAPPDYRNLRLGEAVAASSAVPGLFDPVSFANLYPDKIVRLTDGGVHDNQGVTSLLDQDCTVMLVSDASGQTNAFDQPSGDRLPVLLQSWTISMARVREAELRELDARRRSGLLRGLLYLHLKKDLDADPVNWVGCQDPKDASDEARPPERKGPLTCFGVRKDVQALLSAIRTDLDTFSEVEAFSLMTSGYRMAELELNRLSGLGLPAPRPGPRGWRFLKVTESLVAPPTENERFHQFKQHLQIGARTAGKVWAMSTFLKVLGTVAGLILIGLLVLGWWRWGETALLDVHHLGIVAVVVLLYAVTPRLVKTVMLRGTVDGVGLRVTLASAVAVAFKAQLHLFTPLFRRWGRIERFVATDEPAPNKELTNAAPASEHAR